MPFHARSRVSELTGVLLVSSSILLLLSMVSYHALDPSLNVSSPSENYANYGGKVGAWISDFLIQFLGFSAFCMPFSLLVLGYRRIRSHPLNYPSLKLFGFLCALMAISAGASLFSAQLPGIVHFTPGGVLGSLLSEQLLTYLNRPGALLVVVTLFVSSLLLTTRFSLDTVLSWSSVHGAEFFSLLIARSRLWRKRRSDQRELKRMKKRKKAMVAQQVSTKTLLEKPIHLETIQEELQAEQEKGLDQPRPSIGFSDPFSGESAPTTDSEQVLRPPPPPAKAYELPSLDFLQQPEKETAVDEQELMERAQRLASKCTEFGVHGQVLQIHPGPVVTTFEFKPDPGDQIQPDHQPGRGSLFRAAGGIDPNRSDPREKHGRHRSPQSDPPPHLLEGSPFFRGVSTISSPPDAGPGQTDQWQSLRDASGTHAPSPDCGSHRLRQERGS